MSSESGMALSVNPGDSPNNESGLQLESVWAFGRTDDGQGRLQSIAPRCPGQGFNSPVRQYRPQCSVASLDDKVYIAGGLGYQGDTPSTSYLLIFNTSTCEWRRGPPMRHGRAFHESVASTTSLFVLGGSYYGRDLKSVERLDIARNEWLQMPSMNVKRSVFAAVHLSHAQNEFLLSSGGSDHISLTENISSVELLQISSPSNNKKVKSSWRFLAPTNRSWSQHGMAVLPDDETHDCPFWRILLAGSYKPQPMELLKLRKSDPSDIGQWTTLSNLPYIYECSLLVTQGRLLVLDQSKALLHELQQHNSKESVLENVTCQSKDSDFCELRLGPPIQLTGLAHVDGIVNTERQRNHREEWTSIAQLSTKQLLS